MVLIAYLEDVIMSKSFKRIISATIAVFMLLTVFAMPIPSEANTITTSSDINENDQQLAAPNGIYVANSSYTNSIEDAGEYLKQAMLQRIDSVEIRYKTTSNADAFDIADEIYYAAVKHTGVPNEGDYLNSSWWSRGNASPTEDVSGSTRYISLKYSFSYVSNLEQEQALTKEISKLKGQLDINNASDYVKIKTIYKYICDNIEYDDDFLENQTNMVKLSAYSALINKSTVCSGYASLFYRLALEYGIDARYISGETDSGKNHAWNIVKLDDKYYNVDATWDAGRPQRYFLKGKNDFARHFSDSEYTTSEFIKKYPISSENYIKQYEGDYVWEEDLYGEYATYLVNNPAYNTLLGKMYTEFEKPVYGNSDLMSAVKTAMRTVGDFDAIRYVKLMIGKDDTEEEIAEALALDLIRAVENDKALFNDIMNDVNSYYDWTSKAYGIVSSGYKSKEELDQISEILGSGFVFSKKTAKKIVKDFESVWDQADKYFDVLGDGITSVQIAAQVITTMEANHKIVATLKSNVGKGTKLYKALNKIDKKQKEALSKNLGKAFLTDGMFEKVAGTLVDKGFALGSSAFKPVGMCFSLASEFLPVSADDKVKALQADANCAILSTAVKTKATEIVTTYREKGYTPSTLIYEYETLFSVYMQSIKQYKDGALAVANSKQKKRINSIYNSTKKYLSYDAYIQSCLNNANASWSYNVKNGKASITGVSVGNINTRNSANQEDNISPSYADNDNGVFLFIPEEIDGYEVERIDEGVLKANNDLEAVYIPDSVKSIGREAFANCESLKMVMMGDSLDNIGDKAFNGCTDLEMVDIPYSVKSIGEEAFAGIDDLEISGHESSVAKQYADANENISYDAANLKVINIRIDELPIKLSYGMSEDIDTTGIKVIATYEDGSEKDVSDSIYCEFNTKQVGTCQIYVYYQSLSDSYDVEVKNDKCPYIVRYEDEFGNEIADSVCGEAMSGEYIELEIKSIDGYTAINDEQTELIGLSNEFVVEYKPLPIHIKDLKFTYDNPLIVEGSPSPTVIVEDEYDALVEGIDYVMDYWVSWVPDGTGNGVITITGINDYRGTVELPFDMIEAEAYNNDLSTAEIEFDNSNYNYTGEQIKPVFSVVKNAKILTENVDYTVSYGANKNPGYGSVTVTGIGDYTGEVTAKFTIAKVTNFKAKATGTNYIKLSWAKQPNVKGYKVYRQSGSKYKLIKTISGSKKTSCTVKKLSAGKGYKFKVRAYVGSKPYYGEYSSVLSAPTKPGKVTMSKLSTGKTHYVKASWKKKTGTGYQMMIATNSKFTKNKQSYTVKSYKTKTKTIKGLKKGKTYYVKVRAYKTYGDNTQYGAWSKYKKIKCK